MTNPRSLAWFSPENDGIWNVNTIGYVLPEERYVLGNYETRTMSFFGPYIGEYLRSVMETIIERLMGGIR